MRAKSGLVWLSTGGREMTPNSQQQCDVRVPKMAFLLRYFVFQGGRFTVQFCDPRKTQEHPGRLLPLISSTRDGDFRLFPVLNVKAVMVKR